MDLESIWNSFLEKIKGQMNDISYETWFKEAKLISLDNNLAKISVPTIVHKKQLADHYIDLIEENFTELTGTNFKFEFCTEDELTSNIVIDTNEIGVNEKFKSGLNPDYNFDTFIVGNSNKFAAVSALAVAEQPGNM